MRYQTPLTFNISLREIFSKWESLWVMKKSGKNALMQILQEFGTLSKGFLNRCFLKSGLTNFFPVCNFRNKVAIRIIFFFKMFKIWCIFQKWNKKVWKNNLVEKITAFESGTTNSNNPEQDNCHWQSMCYETSLRFNISLREIFCKSGCPRVMENMIKLLSCRFYKSLGHFNNLTVKGVSKRVFFKGWSNQVFHSL